MPNIRIKDIPTTASATSSTDFIGIDGSANGTRKLNAFSPTFGGNLTVSGGTLAVTPSANDATATLKGRATGTNQLATSSRGSNVTLVNLDTTDNNCEAIAFQNSNELAIASIVAQNVSHTGRTGKLYVNISNGAAPAEALNIAADKTVTLAGNLTVSGTGGVNATAGILRSAASGSASSGSGVEIGGGATPLLLAYNRDTPGYLPMRYHGSSHQLSVPGVCDVTLNASGNFLIGTTTDAASGARLQAQLTGTDGTVSTLLSLRKNTNAVGTGVAIDFIPESTDVPLAKLSAVRTNVNNGYTDFRFSTWNGSALVEQLRLVGQTGNFLIGTTTDGGQKLQVAGTGVFKTTEPSVTLSSTVAGSIEYKLISGGNLGYGLGVFQIADSSTGYVVLNHDKPTSGGTRLSFDGAGNATFAGTGKFATSVTISKTDNPYLLLRKTAATAVDWYLQYNTDGVELYGGTTPAAYFRVLDTGNATFAGTVTTTGSVSASKAVVGGSVVLSARNTDNTNSVSAAVAQLTVGGASAGDPRLLFTIDAVQDWSVGVDNSDGDKFKIGPSSSVGTSTSLTLDPTTGNATFAGNVGLGASPQSGFQLDVQGLTILRGDLYMGSGKDIRLGNAYQAGAPTATGYLIIKDSNGTSYKIPAVAV